MSKKEKLLKRFMSIPSDFSWVELVSLLKLFGYVEASTGKTGGSRRKFINPQTKEMINLHKPHPKEILKQYQMKQIKEHLEEKGLL